MRNSFFIGLLYISYTLAVGRFPFSNVKDVSTKFKNANKYYERTFGDKLLAKQGFSPVNNHSARLDMEFVSSCPDAINGMSGTLFINLINTMFAAQCSLSQEHLYPSSYSNFLSEDNKFDYIVVGAGSAGCVVASRLSENNKYRVLLVEAGDKPSVTTEMPMFLYTLQNTPEDWAYRPEPADNACVGMVDQRCRWPRGKVLGGTSAINGGLYLRGNKQDYDNWAVLNPGWDYKTVQKYFRKIERIMPEYHRSTGKYGTRGPITVDQIPSIHPLRKKIIEGAKTLGYDFYPEEYHNGYFDVLNNIEDGVRVSAAKGYISKIGKRPNLYVAMNAQVARVIIENKVAIGVEVRIQGQIRKVYASQEVILSAGAINSPQLLMLSGVGPKAHLESVNVPVICDLPGVGQNMQDHMMYPGIIVSIDDRLIHKYDYTDEQYNFFRHRKGYYASIGLMSFLGLLSFNNNSNTNDIELHHHVFDKGDIAGLQFFSKQRGFDPGMTASEVEILKKAALHRIMFCISHPKSRGEIKLKSNDPFEYPLIYANYMTDKEDYDINMMLKGINYLRKLYTSAPFRKYNVKLERPYVRNCDSIQDQDAYDRCGLKNIATTVYHLGGTCKMGPNTDKFAVVNAQLKVHGIKQLRVIDASIMPTLVSINTNGPAMMIGERGSDFIKETWNVHNRGGY